MRWDPDPPPAYDDPEPAVDAPGGRRPGRRRSWLQRTVLTAGTTVVVVALLGLSAATYALVKFLGIERVTDLGTDVAAPGDPQNYLVVGSDVRGGNGSSDVEGQRSDTIMILRIDPEVEQAAVLSIPRDLVVPISGTDETARINSAYSHGRSTLVDTIRDNFNIEVHHYVEIDFTGFARLVDYVGGVPLWVGAAIKDDRSGLFVEELGCVTLDGSQALAYVRARQLQYMTDEGSWSRPDPSADLGRIERQQVFMRNALTKALAEIKSNPARIPEVVDIAVDNVAIDDRMSVRELLDLSEHFREFEADGLLTYPLPIIERGDGATLALDDREAEPILNIFRGLDPGEIAPGLVTVTVLNGTGEDAQANDVAGAFQRIGFGINPPGDSDERPERTVVYHRAGEEMYGLRVARHITGGADVLPRDDLDLDEAEVVVVTGRDLSTIHREPTPLDQMPDTGQPPDAGAADEAPAADGPAAEEPAPADPAEDDALGAEPPPRPDVEPTVEEFVVGDPPPGHKCS